MKPGSARSPSSKATKDKYRASRRETRMLDLESDETSSLGYAQRGGRNVVR